MSRLAQGARLAASLVAGDRRALARAITLIESTRSDHRAAAETLLCGLLAGTGRSIRLGISGAPGVGKSTLVEALGLHAIARGHRVAVLAVDPSSPRSGGSILGDKTRMEALSHNPEAFVRPSPAGGTSGGVARRTREAVLACEAAGFDIIMVETVGAGQTDFAVADMVDMFILLVAPGGGDELQGIKKGIMELAELVVVTKADGELARAAARAQAEYASALHLMRPASPDWTPKVMSCSAATGGGIADLWEAVAQYRETMEGAGHLATRRVSQAKAWMWSEVNEALMARLRSRTPVLRLATALEAQVAGGRIAPGEAARRILEAFEADEAVGEDEEQDSAGPVAQSSNWS